MKFRLATTKLAFSHMRRERFFLVSFLFSALLIGLSVFLIWWQLFPEIQSQIFVPLHYNIHFGVDALGPWWRIFTIPMVGMGILLVNTSAAIFLWNREQALSYFFAATSVLSQIILFVALLFVILLNLTYYG